MVPIHRAHVSVLPEPGPHSAVAVLSDGVVRGPPESGGGVSVGRLHCCQGLQHYAGGQGLVEILH